MLRIIQQSHAAAAKSYYRQADYYADGPELAGRWGGRGAATLGLDGEVTLSAFDALCDNRHPTAGGPLTPRTREARRVGYDINFHCPKSLSILYGLTGDERILDAFRNAVGETMAELEGDALTRIRRHGADGERVTGNLTWAEFVHTTARPVDGVPDPHLHAHCFAFNATFDSDERRWKAVDLSAAKRDAPYFESAFHARLAGRLRALGLGIERTAKGWEVAGMPRELIPAFSRRTARIEARAAAHGITDPEAKAALGAKTREAKDDTRSAAELRHLWQERLTPAQRSAVAGVLATPSFIEPSGADPDAAAMAYAVAHCFERQSVVTDRTLLAAALRRGGGAVSVEGVRRELGGHGLLLKARDGRRFATTRDALQEERRLLAFARDGRGTCRPLGGRHARVADSPLDAGQRAAVDHLLTCPDRVMLLRGAAGTGKTTLMREAVAAIEANGRRVVTLAPSAEASRGVLRGEGFPQADTVARFLIDERLQAGARGQVLWVDEAGLLGTKTLAALFDTAGRLEARVVLAGDRRQHAAVERGDALRLLETQAGLPSAEVTAIHRQRGAYKAAVSALAQGDVLLGFDRLAALGWVHPLEDGARERRLAAEYADVLAAGKTALIISPTHAEGGRVTAAVREELRARGRLGHEERPFLRLQDSGLTAAERSDPLHYRFGDVVEWHQHAPGFRRGQRYRVSAVEPDGVRVRDAAGGERILPLNLAGRFALYRPGELGLAVGDRIRVTRNGVTAATPHRLNNGATYAVRGFSPAGDVVLDNGWVVGREFGHLDHGFVVTSHAAQGKTVDVALVAQSAASFAAGSREQFYVSASRARERVSVYTDDVTALRQAVGRSEPRSSAVELVGADRPGRVSRWIEHLRRLAVLARLYAAREIERVRQPTLEME